MLKGQDLRVLPFFLFSNTIRDHFTIVILYSACVKIVLNRSFMSINSLIYRSRWSLAQVRDLRYAAVRAIFPCQRTKFRLVQRPLLSLRTLRHRRVFILAVLQEKHRESARIFYPSVKSRFIRQPEFIGLYRNDPHLSLIHI